MNRLKHKQKADAERLFCFSPLAFGEASHKRLNVRRDESKKASASRLLCFSPLAFGCCNVVNGAGNVNEKKVRMLFRELPFRCGVCDIGGVFYRLVKR